ncbi:MAG: hypothetical protein ACLFPQ_01710 [Candidatus Woesearchaeota archaeon]
MTDKNTNDPDDVFYVEIRNHDDLKRNTLESMKTVLMSLERYEEFLKVRMEKNKAVYDLKRIFKEITALVTKLKSSLPKSNLNVDVESDDLIDKKTIKKVKSEEKKNEEEAKSPNKKSSPKKESSAKIGKSDLEALEKELAAIEAKLGNV